MGLTLAQRYTQALEQLLPRGWAWQKRGCDDSLFNRLLRAFSEELARFHLWYELRIKEFIESFRYLVQGWSAPEYEQLIKARWGIDCVVTDMHWEPLHANSGANSLINARPWQMIFVITIPGLKFYEPTLASHAVAGDELVADRVPILPNGMVQYLLEYKQSHTAFMFRAAEEVINVQAVTADATRASHAVAGDVLVEYDYCRLTLSYDCSFDFDDLPHLPGWADAQAILARYPSALIEYQPRVGRIYA